VRRNLYAGNGASKPHSTESSLPPSERRVVNLLHRGEDGKGRYHLIKESEYLKRKCLNLPPEGDVVGIISPAGTP